MRQLKISNERRVVKVMTADLGLEQEKEEHKLREFLRQVDRSYYHRRIENLTGEAKKLPNLGQDGSMFLNTYQHVRTKGKAIKI